MISCVKTECMCVLGGGEGGGVVCGTKSKESSTCSKAKVGKRFRKDFARYGAP
jgi:hypothetical protein